MNDDAGHFSAAADTAAHDTTAMVTMCAAAAALAIRYVDEEQFVKTCREAYQHQVGQFQKHRTRWLAACRDDAQPAPTQGADTGGGGEGGR